MATERDDAFGYDWGEKSVPTEPEPLVLPDRSQERADEIRPGEKWAEGKPADGSASPVSPAGSLDPEDEELDLFGTPRFTYDPQDVGTDDETDGHRRGVLPAWAILGIVAVQALALVAVVGLVVGGVQRLGGEEPDPSAAPTATAARPTRTPVVSESPRDRVPGTVTDEGGTELTDGTGDYDRPATVGEHAFGWPVWTGGTLRVAAQGVDLAATVPGAAGKNVLQDGYQLVVVTFEVRYEGPGRLAPVEELWLTGESQRTYFPEVGEGLMADPMQAVGSLESGESATFHSAFLVPAAELDSFRLGVETFSGETLYYET